MSRYIATRAIRGANGLVAEADALLKKALAEKGPDTPVAFPNTAYFLPVTLGMLGHEVRTLADLEPVLEHAKKLLHPVPADRLWVPYLGETLDSGQATLLAAEAIEGIRFVYGEQPERYPGLELTGSTEYPHLSDDGHLNGPIDDVQLRSWGIQLVDGRMPGFAAIVGAARSNEAAVAIVRELQKRNILIFLSGNVNGRSVIDQLHEEGVEMGYDTYIVPFGKDTISAIYALGFATRSALTFGGLKPGQWREILLYNKFRVFAFVLALGEVDDLKYAAAAGAISYGFPTIADTVIPEILPTGITRYEHVISMPWNEIEGATDAEKAVRLVQKAVEVRGVKIKITEVPIPVPYGSAFEGEVVRRADMRVEFGGKYSRAFEYLRMVPMGQVDDGKIEVIGPDLDQVEEGGSMDLGILIEVAGRKMQEDFEPVLERQVHYFINGASGIQHIGQRDIAWIRVSKSAAEKGFTLRHFGDILYARFHANFGAIVDKVQVKLITDPELHAHWLAEARKAYDRRNQRLADLTDEAVDTFYDCTLCQSFAPTHVCIVSPQRLGLCGAYNWLDCKASHEINPTGPNQPVPKGELIDPFKGYWTGVNRTAVKNSQGTVQQVALYSIMENPMTACLTADAEVLVDGRLQRIGEVVDTCHAGAKPSQMAVLTVDDDGRLAHSRMVGVHKLPAPDRLVRLVTRSGQELILTPDHEVAVDRWMNNGHGAWVRADEIQVGDRVYVLRHLHLENQTPQAIDLLPGDCRVRDEAVLARVKDKLQARYGSLNAAYRALGLPQPDSRLFSIPLTDLQRMIEGLEEEWDVYKRHITTVAPPTGHPAMRLPEITPDFLYLLGLLAADGSLSRRGRYECRLNFTNTQPALLDAFAEAYERVFPDASLGRREKSDGGTIDGRPIASTRPATDLYGQNFLLGILADSLGVRMRDGGWDLARLLPLPEEHIAAFLAGLFDGDGSVRMRRYEDRWPVGEAYLSLTEARAARHVQWLLRRLGIVGQLRRDRTVYKVELHGADLRRFAEVVPARHPDKASVLAEIASLVPEVDVSLSQILPYEAGRVLADLPESHMVLSPSTLFYYRTGRSSPAADNLRQVMEAEPTAIPVLQPWLEGDTFLDPVVEAEVFENRGQYEHVYNLSLLDINSYIANGVHVKNCGCFECIVMYIPEAEGVMVVSREDPSMTPAGMTFSTLAGMAGGGLQTPGVMGVGKYYLTSPKFLSADGGFKRVVWMSSFLKESMAEEFKAVAEREGVPDLMDRIADERRVTTVDELMAWLKEKDHPVLKMGVMQAASGVVEEAPAPPKPAVAKPEVVEEVKAEVVAEEMLEEVLKEMEEARPVAAVAAPEAVAPPPVAPPPAPAAPAVPVGADIQQIAQISAGIVMDSIRRALEAALRELGVAVPVAPAAPAAPPVTPPPPPAPVEPVAPVAEEAPVVVAAKRKRPAVPPWSEDKESGLEILKEKWTGRVREVTLGATAKEGGTRSHTVTVGGQTAMPFLGFEGALPHRPVVAVEIQDRKPDDWSPLLVEAWGEAMNDPGEWAKAAEQAGADIIALQLSLTDANGEPNTAKKARTVVRQVLQATGLPLIVLGPGQVDADNELLVAVAEEAAGERLALGICEEKNYRTIVAAALAHGHLVTARTAMDVNLAKQLNILISDMGLPPDHILMDPTCAGVGYGMEYGYSVMERLRLAALQGDSMTQLPMIVTVGYEAWRQKESKVGEGVPRAWGDWKERAINWETVTAAALIESGADIIVLRHPETIRRIHAMIGELMGQA